MANENNRIICLEVTPNLFKKIEIECEKQSRSKSSFIRLIIKEYIERVKNASK